MQTIKFAAAVAFAQAINLQEEQMQEEMPMMDDGMERTIIGFLFDGFEFGDLWVELSDEQREEIKTAVFTKALEFGGYDASEFPDNDFYFEEDEMMIPEGGAEGDVLPEDETTLAQWGCGWHRHHCHRPCWGGCGGGWGGPWGGCGYGGGWGYGGGYGCGRCCGRGPAVIIC